MADGGSAATGTSSRAALSYRVEGMDCPSCAGKIETAVGRVQGAGDVRVNYQRQVLAFQLDEALTPRAEVEGRIRKLGYGVAPVAAPEIIASDGQVAEPTPDIGSGRPWWQGRKARLAAAIGALLAVGFAVSTVSAIDHWAYLPAALLGLWFFGRKALAAARAGSPFSIEMLMSIAAAGAILIGATSEAAAVVFLFTIGELLEGAAAGRARAGIEALGALVPSTALRIENGTAREVFAASLAVGDVVLVRPGDRVPADGEVVEGHSDVDESPVTGESMPISKAEGAQVFAGSVNASGALQVRVRKPASDNTIACIVRLVEQAQEAKAPTARFIERFSAIYTPAAVGVASLVVVLPPLLLGGDWGTWIYRGLALLLVACPCALVLSTPAAIASGLAAGARRGLLVKGGGALELIGRVRTVAFDKTGTLTEGRPRVTDVMALGSPERLVLMRSTVTPGQAAAGAGTSSLKTELPGKECLIVVGTEGDADDARYEVFAQVERTAVGQQCAQIEAGFDMKQTCDAVDQYCDQNWDRAGQPGPVRPGYPPCPPGEPPRKQTQDRGGPQDPDFRYYQSDAAGGALSQIKVASWQWCYCLRVMSDPIRTLAAAPACTAHAGTAAEWVVKRFSEASTNTASCVVLKPRSDAQ